MRELDSWQRRRPPDWINNTAEKMARTTASGFCVVTCSSEPNGFDGNLEHHFESLQVGLQSTVAYILDLPPSYILLVSLDANRCEI